MINKKRNDMKKEITVNKVVKRWVSLGIIMIVSMIITFFLLVFLFDYCFHLPAWLALIISFQICGVFLYLVWSELLVLYRERSKL